MQDNPRNRCGAAMPSLANTKTIFSTVVGVAVIVLTIRGSEAALRGSSGSALTIQRFTDCAAIANYFDGDPRLPLGSGTVSVWGKMYGMISRIHWFSFTANNDGNHLQIALKKVGTPTPETVNFVRIAPLLRRFCPSHNFHSVYEL